MYEVARNVLGEMEAIVLRMMNPACPQDGFCGEGTKASTRAHNSRMLMGLDM